jgi:hypothetical protein
MQRDETGHTENPAEIGSQIRGDPRLFGPSLS